MAQKDFETAEYRYQRAQQLIAEIEYHLRDAELDLLAAQICLESKVATLDSKDADFYLQKAKKRIEEIGQCGLMPRCEKVANCESDNQN